MNCANPACGHHESLHYPVSAWDGGHPCMGVMSHGKLGLSCQCRRFVAPPPSREPLMAQLEAMIRSRQQLP